ncbi:hypothetical protein FNF27_06399 [Cafeteria roenbergensis]|uniref:Uncharacterized protein n=1 Tax=Cafeteria roenbergensis TaxID=33653 RepID=A0A5A8E024_CAFRO|nr:hypothetical protein FNF27_06399 [Cafeteria roenbergensis]
MAATPMSTDEMGKALWKAAELGDTRAAAQLLDAGAPVNWQNKEQYGYSVLMKAVSCDQPHAVRLLLDRGADLEARNTWGRSISESAKTEAMRAILKHPDKHLQATIAGLRAQLVGRQKRSEEALAAKQADTEAALAAKQAEMDAALAAKQAEMDAALAAKQAEMDAALAMAHARHSATAVRADNLLLHLADRVTALERTAMEL